MGAAPGPAAAPIGAGPGARVGVSSPGGQAVVSGPGSTPIASGGLPGRVGCPVCGGENQAGMNFCRLCGSHLVARAPQATPIPPMPTPVPGARIGPGAPPEVHVCRRCGGHTQPGFAFCQQCGAILPTAPGSARERPADGPIRERPEEPRWGAGARAGHTPPIEPVHHEPSSPVAASMPGGGPAARAMVHGAAPPPAAVVPAVHITPPPVQPARGTGERAWGSLFSVRRDGTDGDRYPLAGEWIEIGRPGGAGADLVFDDRYLATRHARLELIPGGGARVVPIDLLNGVYRRIRGPHVIPSGTQILLGRELLRFELLDDAERDATSLSRFGVAMFGSPPRAPWGRLVQVLPSGGLRDVRHLHGGEVVLGREEGEIVFRDDEFLSRRHAVLRWQGGQCVLEDLKSSNGTFLRLRGPQPLEHGDTLRMGDQMFRVELQNDRSERGT